MKPVITYFVGPFRISCSEPSAMSLTLGSTYISLVPAENSNGTFVLLTSLDFSCTPLQSCMLSNDTLRSAFSATSHEYHGTILSRKPSSLYRILHFTCSHRNQYSHSGHDILKKLASRSWPATQFTIMSTVSLCVNSKMLSDNCNSLACRICE